MDDAFQAGPDMRPGGGIGEHCLGRRIDQDAGGQVEYFGAATGGEMDGGPEFIGPLSDFGDLVEAKTCAEGEQDRENQPAAETDGRGRRLFGSEILGGVHLVSGL